MKPSEGEVEYLENIFSHECAAVPRRAVFKAHRLVYHSALGSKITENTKKNLPPGSADLTCLHSFLTTPSAEFLTAPSFFSLHNISRGSAKLT